MGWIGKIQSGGEKARMNDGKAPKAVVDFDTIIGQLDGLRAKAVELRGKAQAIKSPATGRGGQEEKALAEPVDVSGKIQERILNIDSIMADALDSLRGFI